MFKAMSLDKITKERGQMEKKSKDLALRYSGFLRSVRMYKSKVGGKTNEKAWYYYGWDGN